MGQGASSDTSNPFISATEVMQELERMKFAQNLRKNPSDYNAYVNQRIDQLSSEVINKKRSAFQKAHIDLGRYMDMDHNANFYKSRSADVDRLADNIEQNNRATLDKIKYDKDVTRRQFEINEWYNYNKLETLFFLQLFFIAALSGAIVVFLHKNGMITPSLAALIYGILGVIVGGTGLYRYYYTSRTRDPRLWHRRYFGDPTPPKPAVQCDKGGSVVFNVNDVIPKSVTECADDATRRFEKWQSGLEDELLKYQTTGASPASQMGSICSVSK